MIQFFYEIGLLFLSLFQLPKILRQKYRRTIAKKFGFYFPQINKGERLLIWIHAVSVGETKAIAPLAKLLEKELNPYLLISSTTETGHAEAQRSIPFADAHVYLPFDFGWVIKPIVKQVAPDLVLLSESDFWFNFLNAAKSQGAKLALINGKLSERSFNRFQKIPWFTKALFHSFDALCLQSRHYYERFLHLGLSAQKLTVTGNVKFDDAYTPLSPTQLLEWKKQLGISSGDRVLVIGSTHDPEEKMVLDVLDQLWGHFPSLKVLIVPRHPERFNEVANLLQQRKVPYQRYSNLNGHPAKVLLIDAMGLLRKCYQIAEVALVAGSFTPKIGGHNIVEPSWNGVPVLFGPYMHAQPELLELVHSYSSGLQVTLETLPATLRNLLDDPAQQKALGEAGLRLVHDMQGATRKTWHVLKDLL